MNAGYHLFISRNSKPGLFLLRPSFKTFSVENLLLLDTKSFKSTLMTVTCDFWIHQQPEHDLIYFCYSHSHARASCTQLNLLCASLITFIASTRQSCVRHTAHCKDRDPPLSHSSVLFRTATDRNIIQLRLLYLS